MKDHIRYRVWIYNKKDKVVKRLWFRKRPSILYTDKIIITTTDIETAKKTKKNMLQVDESKVGAVAIKKFKQSFLDQYNIFPEFVGE